MFILVPCKPNYIVKHVIQALCWLCHSRSKRNLCNKIIFAKDFLKQSPYFMYITIANLHKHTAAFSQEVSCYREAIS